MTLKVYCYSGCGTCKKALKWLDEKGVAYKVVPIREKPPSKKELKEMLTAMDGNIRKLFNTSSGDYKEGNFKERLPGLSDAEAIDILSQQGNLVKRPFVVDGKAVTVGFKADLWETLFG